MKLLARRRLREIPIRSNIPNMITSGNLLCGMLAMVLTLRGHYVTAAWMIPMAVAFDFCDGMVARAMGLSSDFGVEFDSLGDVVSFGVAPALLIYTVYLKNLPDVVGTIVVLYFTLCGALRLARFNVVHCPGPFQGFPIPAAGIFMVSWVMAGLHVPPALIAGLSVLSGTLMISSVPYGNLKSLKRNSIHFQKIASLLVFVLVTVALLKSVTFLILSGIYLASGLLSFNWSDWLSTDRAQQKDRDEKS